MDLRVVCMIPSWTETLIECGVQVVGRTRFCIHPTDKVKSIPVVGGTKDIDWEKLKALNADLLLLDQEENPKWMHDDSPIQTLATHITRVEDVGAALGNMAEALGAQQCGVTSLEKLASRWRAISLEGARLSPRTLAELPVMEWLKPLSEKPGVDRFVYLIWKNPWMAVSRQTFIGSVFEKLGFGWAQVDFDEKYPEIQLGALDPETTGLLFSTEPFPFAKKKQDLLKIPNASALVDGESYSWFGFRTLEFLEKELRKGGREGH